MSKGIGNLIYIIAIIWVSGSCKLSNKAISGTYKLEKYPKTVIKINSNGTFEFVKNYANPYRHPLDHPEQLFCISKGTWTHISKDTIILVSSQDSLVYPLVEVKTKKPKDSTTSHFTFYDSYSDTVKILYVKYSDSSELFAEHRSMPDFNEDLRERDTFEFHFFGYKPWLFISGKQKNCDYDIFLKPIFKPSFFKNALFAIKRDTLIDVKRQGFFYKTRSGS